MKYVPKLDDLYTLTQSLHSLLLTLNWRASVLVVLSMAS